MNAVSSDTRSWLRRLYDWLEEPTAPRWFWVFAFMASLNLLADIANWLLR